ncbi:hypothetical protein [Bradyrhizobium elkanii]|uniref:hypothetical protein n=1 Tax=Bradyrhizobium elkanii TaxID=29448 RepID=UPI0012FD5261|nr:hypothetical protein [Bradyrhizobium elkanii]WLA79626.1 hypothetical protein QNJ99_30045 [Bradyrhizobium elkanii]
MTRLPGVPDRDDIRPGMAHFPGTGPFGKTCGTCVHRGYWRKGKDKIDPKTHAIISHQVRTGGCKMFLILTHAHGPAISKNWEACRHYVERPSHDKRS